jgi:hypothetical protein
MGQERQQRGEKEAYPEKSDEREQITNQWGITPPPSG